MAQTNLALPNPAHATLQGAEPTPAGAPEHGMAARGHDAAEPEKAVDFRARVLETLVRGQVPFAVTGAYAFFEYTGIRRDTKDLDVAIRREDLPIAFRALDAAGFRTEVHPERWLAKAWSGDHFVDLIFSSRNGVMVVDEGWFEHAKPSSVLGVACSLVPAEELLWSKAFVHERERFDGADVNHLILSSGPTFDWDRVLYRFGDHWEVLLAHLILYQFAFPSSRSKIPAWLLRELFERARRLNGDEGGRICRGHLVSGTQYATDYSDRGFVIDPAAPPSPAETFNLAQPAAHAVPWSAAKVPPILTREPSRRTLRRPKERAA